MVIKIQYNQVCVNNLNNVQRKFISLNAYQEKKGQLVTKISISDRNFNFKTIKKKNIHKMKEKE